MEISRLIHPENYQPVAPPPSQQKKSSVEKVGKRSFSNRRQTAACSECRRRHLKCVGTLKVDTASSTQNTCPCNACVKRARRTGRVATGIFFQEERQEPDQEPLEAVHTFDYPQFGDAILALDGNILPAFMSEEYPLHIFTQDQLELQ